MPTSDYDPILLSPDAQEMPETSSLKKAPADDGFWSGYGAELLSHNWAVRMITGHNLNSIDDYATTTDYNPIDKAIENGIQDPRYLKLFEDVDTTAEFNETMKYVKEQQGYDEMLDTHSFGTRLLYGLGNASVDPIWLAGTPLLSAAKGATALSTGLKTAGITAGLAAASEGLLMSTKPEETWGEAGINVAATALVGGLLGSGVHLLANRVGVEKDVASLLKGESKGIDTTPNGLSISAAEVPKLTPEDFKLHNEKAVKFGWFGFRPPPAVDIMLGPTKGPKEVIANLTDIPLSTEGTRAGKSIGQSAFTNIQLHEARQTRFEIKVEELYREHKSEARGAGQKPLTREEFYKEVSYAKRRLNEDDIGRNPQARKAAELYHDMVQTPGDKAALEVGALDQKFKKSIDEDPGHLHRMYDQELIVKDTKGWKDAIDADVRAKLDTHISKLESRLKELESEKLSKADESKMIKRGEEIEEIKRQLRFVETPEEYAAHLEEIKQHITDSVLKLGKEGQSMFKIEPVARGPMKDRTLSIDDKVVEKYLVNDIMKIGRHYTRNAAAEIELRRSFPESDGRFENIYGKLLEEHNQYMETIKGDKARLNADKDFRRRMASLQNIWEQVRGTDQYVRGDRLWARIANNLKAFQYLDRMALFAARNIPDLGQIVFNHGLGKALKYPISKLNMSAIQKAVNKMSIEDARAAYMGVNGLRSHYMMSMAQVMEPSAKNTLYERMTHVATQKFSKMTGINWFTDMEQTLNSLMTSDRIYRNVKKESLNANELEWMGGLGLGERERMLIREQITKYGVEEEGITAARTDFWDNEAAKRAFLGAMNRDSRRAFSQGAPGSLPGWMESPGGSLLMQFTKFIFNSHQNLMVASINRGDRHVLEGFTTMIALGMMTSVLIDKIKGKEITTDPKQLFYDGIEMSAIGALPLLVNDKILEPFNLGLSRAIGVRPSYKVKTGAEGVAGMFGPTAGTLGTVFNLGKSLTRDLDPGEKRLTESSLRQASGLIPLHNYYVIGNLVDRAIENIAKSNGLKRSKKQGAVK